MGTGIENVIIGGSTIKDGVDKNNGSQLAQGAATIAQPVGWVEFTKPNTI
ncbi:hypothetical protein [Moraxella oblonga]|nr:hypothetical protein [Moraxella oblonga]